MKSFPQDSVIFDFGVYDGATTNQLARKIGKKGFVYGWEAYPQAVEIFADIEWEPNLEIVYKAVNEYNGSVTFHVSHTEERIAPCSSILKPVLNCGRPKTIQFKEKPVYVPCQTLDSFCSEKGIDHINLIWADIQGGEKLLIKGGQEMFAKTDYFYSELMKEARYEDMILKDKDFISLLPGKWDILLRTNNDIFLKRGEQSD